MLVYTIAYPKIIYVLVLSRMAVLFFESLLVFGAYWKFIFF